METVFDADNDVVKAVKFMRNALKMVRTQTDATSHGTDGNTPGMGF
jgi:hypothetical protein